MYRLKKGPYIIFFPATEDGLQQAREERKQNSLFKRGRIIDVLNLKPSEVTFGWAYNSETGELV